MVGKLKPLLLATLSATALMAAAPASASKILRFESVQPGSSFGQFTVAWVKAVEANTPHKLQVSTGKPVTKSVLMGAKGRIDLFIYTPGIYAAMKHGAAMYKKVKGAKEASQNLRGILNFRVGIYHYLAYESTGIRSFADLKNKKVFLGPPGGIAPRLSGAVIQAVSGLKAKKDYTLMRFDWTASRPAFSDRQMHVTGFPTNAPSPVVQEYGASEKLVFLGIPDDKLDSPIVKKVLSAPGRTLTSYEPAKVYGDRSATTGKVNTIASWGGLATNKNLDPQVVYDMLKAYWGDLDKVHATAAWMKQELVKESALKEMNIPLHLGAYRYYKEHGWDVPDAIKPPEAK